MPIIRTGPIAGLYDVFEPTFIQVAFTKHEHLGHLVFGQATWLKLSGNRESELYLNNPLTEAFTAMGNQPLSCIKLPSADTFDTVGIPLDISTNLLLETYDDQLFLPSQALKATRISPTLYHGIAVSQKALWTITPNFPTSLVSPIASLPMNIVA